MYSVLNNKWTNIDQILGSQILCELNLSSILVTITVLDRSLNLALVVILSGIFLFLLKNGKDISLCCCSDHASIFGLLQQRSFFHGRLPVSHWLEMWWPMCVSKQYQFSWINIVKIKEKLIPAWIFSSWIAVANID